MQSESRSPETRGLSFQSGAQTHSRGMFRHYEWKLSLPLTYSQAWEEFVESKYCLCKLLKITGWLYKIKHIRVCRQSNKMLSRRPELDQQTFKYTTMCSSYTFSLYLSCFTQKVLQNLPSGSLQLFNLHFPAGAERKRPQVCCCVCSKCFRSSFCGEHFPAPSTCRQLWASQGHSVNS